MNAADVFPGSELFQRGEAPGIDFMGLRREKAVQFVSDNRQVLNRNFRHRNVLSVGHNVQIFVEYLFECARLNGRIAQFPITLNNGLQKLPELALRLHKSGMFEVELLKKQRLVSDRLP